MIWVCEIDGENSDTMPPREHMNITDLKREIFLGKGRYKVIERRKRGRKGVKMEDNGEEQITVLKVENVQMCITGLETWTQRAWGGL